MLTQHLDHQAVAVLTWRTFEAGKDRLWTALNIPDDVNAAIGLYNSSNVDSKACDTPGANFPDVSTSAWPPDQGHLVKAAQVNPALVTSNVYHKLQVSAGRDAYADLGLIDGKESLH
ncbi:hypothetical protein H310_07406 [Aphanomyces invadans]|uniref:Uncharacterized protein n=1 Tax=Aphanomyces invadans TaxID=157072 RepID=A0A024U253_9STRA|nr:hypothetical protein H310_07406 [Aphanomyces invadans]ETV99951.1 hypothetical protein H310_07406 [Aphanomyces invadans]|eukprot:XP_008871369.1 hypothetical protein H310_07406 [Aphanomyces invadans]